jgi:hypothetical protein
VKPFEQRQLHATVTICPELQIANQKVRLKSAGTDCAGTANVVCDFVRLRRTPRVSVLFNPVGRRSTPSCLQFKPLHCLLLPRFLRAYDRISMTSLGGRAQRVAVKHKTI